MKSIYTLLFLTLISFNSFAQEEWKYVDSLSFPVADSVVTPFLMTIDSNGRVYVASSKVTSSRAQNAVFYADSTDSAFHTFINYSLNGDSDTLTGNIAAIRGIGSVGTDVFINANIPFQRVGTTVSAQYRYPNGDTAKVEKLGYNILGSGYGTYIHAIALTRDTILMTGITFNTSIRFYNFNRTITTPGYGSWVPITAAYPVEPGGPHAGGFDVIRDVATVPNADYNNVEVPFYTSRNSLSSSQVTGGIAIWTGGNQLNPGGYTGTRVQDAAGELALGTSIPYGITVDKNGYLWVAGNDTTRRWVKAYQVMINFASNMFSLPAKNDPINPDPNGAPMINPTDVVLTADGLTAYVCDASTKKVYKFKYMAPAVSVRDEMNPSDFTLNQNFPNPFNPSTVISFKLATAGEVKLVVTNSLGEVVEELVNGYKNSGVHNVSFDGTNLASGVYNYTLTAGTGIISKKMILVK